jgi:hypothetical protein
MVVPFPQIQEIVKLPPNAGLISEAKTTADKLMMHVFGIGLNGSIPKYGYFESQEIYNERKVGAISNKDLFARLLQREEMVFTAQGGVSFYEGLGPAETLAFDELLDNIRYNMTIREWVKEFGLKAYRTDPMSLLYVEVGEDGSLIYPTYKSISCIYDYVTTGRKVEYVCFSLTVGDCRNFGVKDDTLKDMASGQVTNYFRFVDDDWDYILKNDNGVVLVYDEKPNIFEVVPAIVTSDLINFTNPQKFLSPLEYVIELADTFLTDRSIRDLSKKYSGFPKTIEPLVQCGRCDGTGTVSGAACPDCTPAGWVKGTGYKLLTKVSDSMKIPITDDNFDYKKYFGYVSPDVKVWDKQDTSLNDTENFMRDVYWGTYNRQSTTGPTVPQSTIEETATKTLADLQPIYTRLNLTADWAEGTENALCDLIGKFKFANFEGSTRTYGRYYILETPDELLVEYLDAKSQGCPVSTLNEILSKYYHSFYAENKIKLTIQLKLMNVEPFVHYSVVQVQAANPAKIDFVQKMYFSEWLAGKDQAYLLAAKEPAMVADLLAYATAKIALAPELVAEPVSVLEQTRNQQ